MLRKGVCERVCSLAVSFQYGLLANKLRQQPSALYIAAVLSASAFSINIVFTVVF